MKTRREFTESSNHDAAPARTASPTRTPVLKGRQMPGERRPLEAVLSESHRRNKYRLALTAFSSPFRHRVMAYVMILIPIG